jgi:UDP-glucose 4-epimerase
MKIIVTGALGHIGSRLIRELPTKYPNAEIVMIDSLFTQRYPSLFNLPAEAKYRFIEGDVLTLDLDPVFDEADVAIHLAAITDATNSFQKKDQVEHVNFNATLKVAETCVQAGVPLIHLSSTSVYGTQNEVVDEECSKDELQPQSPYAETKLKEEEFLRNLGNTGKLNFITCRFGTITGTSPGMRFHTAVNKFCWQAVMGQPITVWKTALHQKRPYLTLSDAIKAVQFIIQNKLFDREVYNVLTENLTVNAILEYIRLYIPGFEIEYVDTEIMNQLSYEVLNERIRKQGLVFGGSVRKCVNQTIDLLKK